jgi:hypothetical protein
MSGVFFIDHPKWELEYIQKAINYLEDVKTKLGEEDLKTPLLLLIKTRLSDANYIIRGVYENIYESKEC